MSASIRGEPWKDSAVTSTRIVSATTGDANANAMSAAVLPVTEPTTTGGDPDAEAVTDASLITMPSSRRVCTTTWRSATGWVNRTWIQCGMAVSPEDQNEPSRLSTTLAGSKLTCHRASSSIESAVTSASGRPDG